MRSSQETGAGSPIPADIDLANCLYQDLQRCNNPIAPLPPKGPSVRVLDKNDRPVQTSVQISARVFGDLTGSLLKGTTVGQAGSGSALFDNLMIQKEGVYRLEFDVSGSNLSSVSQVFSIGPSTESLKCKKPSDFIIDITEQPHPFWCDGQTRDPEDHPLPRTVIVGNCFRVFVSATPCTERTVIVPDPNWHIQRKSMDVE